MIIRAHGLFCPPPEHRLPPPPPFSEQLDSRVGVDEPLFQPFPHEIVFYRPKELETVEATLWLRNNDNVRRIQPPHPRDNSPTNTPSSPPTDRALL